MDKQKDFSWAIKPLEAEKNRLKEILKETLAKEHIIRTDICNINELKRMINESAHDSEGNKNGN